MSEEDGTVVGMSNVAPEHVRAPRRPDMVYELDGQLVMAVGDLVMEVIRPAPVRMPYRKMVGFTPAKGDKHMHAADEAGNALPPVVERDSDELLCGDVECCIEPLYAQEWWCPECDTVLTGRYVDAEASVNIGSPEVKVTVPLHHSEAVVARYGKPCLLTITRDGQEWMTLWGSVQGTLMAGDRSDLRFTGMTSAFPRLSRWANRPTRP